MQDGKKSNALPQERRTSVILSHIATMSQYRIVDASPMADGGMAGLARCGSVVVPWTSGAGRRTSTARQGLHLEDAKSMSGVEPSQIHVVNRRDAALVDMMAGRTVRSIATDVTAISNNHFDAEQADRTISFLTKPTELFVQDDRSQQRVRDWQLATLGGPIVGHFPMDDNASMVVVSGNSAMTHLRLMNVHNKQPRLLDNKVPLKGRFVKGDCSGNIVAVLTDACIRIIYHIDKTSFRFDSYAELPLRAPLAGVKLFRSIGLLAWSPDGVVYAWALDGPNTFDEQPAVVSRGQARGRKIVSIMTEVGVCRPHDAKIICDDNTEIPIELNLV